MERVNPPLSKLWRTSTRVIFWLLASNKSANWPRGTIARL
jgi:hypothetical protein